MNLLRISYANVNTLSENPEGLPLSDYRLSRLHQLRPALKRRQSIGAELLLIDAIRELEGEPRLPLRIETDENGKPRLAGEAFCFSLSHSDSFAACAVSDRPVGLDIQCVRPFRPELLRRCLCREEEQYVFRSADRESAFTEIWAKKESFVKARGDGLRIPLNSFSVFDLPDGASVWNTVVDGFQISVCILSGSAIPDEVIKKQLP